MTFSVPTTLIVWTVIILVIMCIKKIIKTALIILLLGYGCIVGYQYAIAHHYIDKGPIVEQVQKKINPHFQEIAKYAKEANSDDKKE